MAPAPLALASVFPDTMVNVSLFPHVDLLCNEGNEIWIAADTERERLQRKYWSFYSLLRIAYFLHHAIDQFWSVCIHTTFSTSLTSCHPHEKMMVMQ